MKSIRPPFVLFCNAFLCFLIPLSLFLAGDGQCASGGHAADTHLSGADTNRGEQTLAKSSPNMPALDEQNSTVPFKMHGLGVPMARLLEVVEQGSVGFRQKFTELWRHLPKLLPDLYRVHVTL